MLTNESLPDQMKVNGKQYHTIWPDTMNPAIIHCIDQRKLPFEFVTEQLTTAGQVCEAIRDMHLRGAPLIGVAAAFGIYLSALEHEKSPGIQQELIRTAGLLKAARPTAVNLKYAVDRQLAVVQGVQNPEKIISLLFTGAQNLLEEELENCRMIGKHGLEIIKKICRKKGNEEINILTHCNAGWLACIDYGTATAPIYLAHDEGIRVHVWVDETRPRNQGARLTAWELGQHGVKHTIIADNTGGHLMQHGMVDLVLVGSDRTTRNGDVANKIGTYLKALAAFDNGIPFYAALPSTSIDWNTDDGLSRIPIEVRDPDEVHYLEGMEDNMIRKIRITPAESTALNFGFDVTPARLITGLITEKGLCEASAEGLIALFSQK
jgi:methylthioribose-1-phosphate isomerase